MYMNSVTIRLAGYADAQDMAEIHMRSWEAAYSSIIPADYINEKNATRSALWERVLSAENTTQYAIEKDGRIAGFLGMGVSRDDDLDDNCFELFAIYLHPEYYRQGVGTSAMEFVCDKARSEGKSMITVWVLAENISSVKFYEKCGFSADGKTQEMDYGRTMRCIRMRKALQVI